MRDFEQFLYTDRQTDIFFKCCGKHGEVEKIDDLDHWRYCIEYDSFNQILLNNFKVELPKKLV